MFCAKCGAKLPENAKFCAKCGNKVLRPSNSIKEMEESVLPKETDFPALKKLKIGYITIAVTFVLSALICIGLEAMDGFFLSFLLLIGGYILGVYLVLSANKASKMLEPRQAEEMKAFINTWYKPVNCTSIVYVIALVIKLFND